MEQFQTAAIVSGLPLDFTPLAIEIHADNIRAGWWKTIPAPGPGDYATTIPRNIGELLCLVHSEISEADEGLIGNLFDDKLPHRLMFEVELADTSIRVLDILGYHKFPGTILPKGAFPIIYGDNPIRLMHRTVSQAMEEFRKGRANNGCHRLTLLLSLIHYTALALGLDLSGAIAEKRAFNAQRADHKIEARQAVGGKSF